MSGERRPTIRASEVGEYEWCARSWWLRHVLGWESRYPERLAAGVEAHAAHGRAVSGSRRLVLVGAAALALALALAVLL